MPADDFIKDINAKKLKGVQDRLKKEKPNCKFTDAKTKAFYTPLHAAVKANSLAIVDALLAAGADVAAVDNTSATPLHWAAKLADGDAVAITGIRTGLLYCP